MLNELPDPVKIFAPRDVLPSTCYEYYVKFLDGMLRKREKEHKASILQQNLFIVLTSADMLALSRLLSIIHLSVSLSFRYLAGKTQDTPVQKAWLGCSRHVVGY
jgi:hypothetical protein